MSVTFSKTITVTPEDLDELHHVNNIRYVEWIQEIARQHWQKVTQGHYDKTHAWVVRKHNITYYHAAQLNDEITITTWVEQFKGPISPRKVVIKDHKTERVLVEAITDWCFVDIGTLKPKRVPAAVVKLFQ